MKEHQLKELIRITGLTEDKIMEVPRDFIESFLSMRSAISRTENRMQNIADLISNLETQSPMQIGFVKHSLQKAIDSIIRDFGSI